jgi:hypothetical protein
LPLGLTLRTTLGIPGLSVGSEAICVGSDRLARTLAARRQRLSVGAEARRLRSTLLATGVLSRCMLLLVGTFGAGTARTRTTGTTGTAARTPIAIATAEFSTATTRTGAGLGTFGTRSTTFTRTAEITTSAARTAGTSRTAAATRATSPRTTSAARTTTITIAASASRTAASTAITEVARCGRELPADARFRHLAATRTIVFLLLFFGRAHLQAAEATRLVAIAATTEAAATTTTAGTTTAATTAIAATATTAITAIAAATIITTTTTRRASDAIDHVMKLATRDGAVWTLLALEHAHETNLIDAIADDVECLEQARRAIGLNIERSCDGLDRRIRRRARRRRIGILRHRRRLFGCGDLSSTRVGDASLGFASLYGAFAALGRRLLIFTRRRLLGSGLHDLGCRSSSSSSSSRRSGSFARGGRIAQKERRELGQRLHSSGLLHQISTRRQAERAPENENADEGLGPRRRRIT